jgi:predicted PurR-regulated permease PerM
MNDAAARLSGFFLLQTLVNASFGVIVAVGLYFIGLPSPILWGVVAFLLRFVPLHRPVHRRGFPHGRRRSTRAGAWRLALFLFVEPIIGQVVEPWLYGHNIGISPIAVVISATFWTSLWGSVGLVLSTPLTVCLVGASCVARYAASYSGRKLLSAPCLSGTPRKSPTRPNNS